MNQDIKPAQMNTTEKEQMLVLLGKIMIFSLQKYVHVILGKVVLYTLGKVFYGGTNSL